MKKIYFYKIAAFVMIIVLFLNIASEILTPKDCGSLVQYNGEILGFRSFYEEPENTVDVVFIGSSHVYSGISPMELWHEYGITGYDCTSSSQDSYKAYHYLKEILKYQKPEVVVFDLMALFIDETTDEISNRSALGNMRFSYNFIQTAYHALNEEESLLSYIFPVFRYHSRWEELSEADFRSRKQRDHYKGYDMRYGYMNAVPLTEENFPCLNQKYTKETAEYNQKSAENIRKMVELCKKKQTEILFIKTPITGYTLESGNAMKTFADACEVRLIDFNLKFDELGLDIYADFLDTVHLNLSGAKKLTRSLGAYLANYYELEDHRGEAEYTEWDKDWDYYTQSIKVSDIRAETDIDAWLDGVKEKEYCLLLNGSTGNLSDHVKETLGIHKDTEQMMGYFNDGQFVEGVAEEGHLGQRIGKCRCMVFPLRTSVLGEMFDVDEGKFQIVVVDKILEKVVDRRII